MAVPRHFTEDVLKAGGRFMKLKSPKKLDPQNLQLLQWKKSPDPTIHILHPGQHRSYEMMGKQYVEDMSLCSAIFEQSRGGGYQVFKGMLEQVSCAECRKKLKP